VADVAELVNVSERQVYKLVAEHRIPCFKIGGSIRFDPLAVALWLRMKMAPASVAYTEERQRGHECGTCLHIAVAQSQASGTFAFTDSQSSRANFDEATCKTSWHVLDSSVEDLLRSLPSKCLKSGDFIDDGPVLTNGGKSDRIWHVYPNAEISDVLVVVVSRHRWK